MKRGKNTSYFLNLEKRCQIKNKITKLFDENGKCYTTDQKILDCCSSFYSKLYDSKCAKKAEIDKYLKQVTSLPLLSLEDQNLCEGSVTLNECEKAIKIMENNMSPGSDGLTVEFYKTFWPDVADILVDSFNEAFTMGNQSYSQNLSILSLIYKKGDRTNPKNYRPISLTNVDYRILAFTLALRLQKVIGNIISPEQTRYVKDRFIGTNIRAILDIVEEIEKSNNSGILLLLDFEKAFDSVEWHFILSVLKKFNFGSQFIRWIKVLYSNPICLTKNNGHFSIKLKIKRGIRQGCPISALLFILIIEILAQVFRTDKVLKGIRINMSYGEKEFKSFQYADDISVFLQNEHQIDRLKSIISNFSNVAGPKLDTTKTEGLWLGN